MADIKIKSSVPHVEDYILVVSLPIEKPLKIVRSQSVGMEEEFLISEEDDEISTERMAEIARVRAILKWADCCMAVLLEMHNADKKLVLSFDFITSEDMIQFRDQMSAKVAEATATI